MAPGRHLREARGRHAPGSARSGASRSRRRGPQRSLSGEAVLHRDGLGGGGHVPAGAWRHRAHHRPAGRTALARPAQPHDHRRHPGDHAHGARPTRAQHLRMTTKEKTMADKEYKNILIEREGGITFLWLNRPDKRNAMSPDLHFDMDDALDWLATDKETKVLVLGGKGEAWCAGQDLRLYFRGTQDNPEMRYKANNASHSWRRERLSQFPKPTIAMVHANASAGPSTQLSACDFAVVAKDSTFGLSEVNGASSRAAS